jgi:hypothetical protein
LRLHGRCQAHPLVLRTHLAGSAGLATGKAAACVVVSGSEVESGTTTGP